jgi:hypothetical protein
MKAITDHNISRYEKKPESARRIEKPSDFSPRGDLWSLGSLIASSGDGFTIGNPSSFPSKISAG